MAANAFKYVSSLICKDNYNLPKPKQGDVGRLYLILRLQNTVLGGLDLDDAVAG